MKTNTSATLYSRSVVAGAESWSRSVISKVFWENRKAANIIQSGLLAADSVAIYIPDSTLTIKPGDVFVKGTVTDVIQSGTFTITDLKAKYPNVVVVKSVDLMDYGASHMQHLQIGAS